MEQNKNIPGYAPAQALQHSPISRQFYYWLGASGERYLHTVFPIDADFSSPGANLIIVRCQRDGERIPLYIGRIGDLSAEEINDLRYSYSANELHIHLMAPSDAAAHEIALDLNIRHMKDSTETPGLSEAPAPALAPPAVFFANVNF